MEPMFNWSRRPDLNREPPDYKAGKKPILVSADAHFKREIWPVGSPTDDELAPRCRQRCRQETARLLTWGAQSGAPAPHLGKQVRRADSCLVACATKSSRLL